jgi:hypothetical protein
VDEFNHLLAEVAARHPGTVSVIDLNRILDPHGVFQSVIDKVTVRWPDGIHVSKPGGEWLQARVLPTIAQLGLEVRPTLVPRGPDNPSTSRSIPT